MTDRRTNSASSVRGERIKAFLATLPADVSNDEAAEAWREHAAFMSKVYSPDAVSRERLAEQVERFRAEKCVRCKRTARLKDRDICKACNYEEQTGKPFPTKRPPRPKAKKVKGGGRTRRSSAPFSKDTSLRRARGDGECPLCRRAFRQGDMLAGTKGNWFHEVHLTEAQLRKLYKKRAASQTRYVSGGSPESNRRKH